MNFEPMLVGIDPTTLRKLVLESLTKRDVHGSHAVKMHVERTAKDRGLLLTEKECASRGLDYRYYREGRLSPIDHLRVMEIIYDLLIERVITAGFDDANQEWPHFRVTDYGKKVVFNSGPHFNDPDAYIEYLKEQDENIDDVTVQYVHEGLQSFRRNLYFATAVMFGAAAERSVLRLLQSIEKSHSDPTKAKKIKQLIDRPKMPVIFDVISKTVESLSNKKILPYSVHEGSTEHLLSLFEMIRTHRNNQFTLKL